MTKEIITISVLAKFACIDSKAPEYLNKHCFRYCGGNSEKFDQLIEYLELKIKNFQPEYNRGKKFYKNLVRNQYLNLQ
jgi:hypothetical protein